MFSLFFRCFFVVFSLFFRCILFERFCLDRPTFFKIFFVAGLENVVILKKYLILMKKKKIKQANGRRHSKCRHWPPLLRLLRLRLKS